MVELGVCVWERGEGGCGVWGVGVGGREGGGRGGGGGCVWWWWCGPVCNDACLSMTTHEMHLIMEVVSLWTRPPALYLCTGPQKLHLSCPGDTNHAADECTAALCVPVSVVQQRRLDLIDELQLRGSAVFCTSIPGICRAPQRACQHP